MSSNNFQRIAQEIDKIAREDNETWLICKCSNELICGGYPHGSSAMTGAPEPAMAALAELIHQAVTNSVGAREGDIDDALEMYAGLTVCAHMLICRHYGKDPDEYPGYMLLK